jgi:hypothetical protein
MTARAHKDQDFALLRRKLGQCSAEVLEIEVTFLIAEDLETTHIQCVAVLDLAGALAIVGIVDVAQNREQPRPQASPGLELVRFAPGSQKRLLNEVVSGRFRPAERYRERPQMLDFGGSGRPRNRSRALDPAARLGGRIGSGKRIEVTSELSCMRRPR